ncbi:hypothetical protein B9Q04_20685 [Candidatus Marsarchaeota G2 archaeon BE_D]|uniref:Uncharacterized protein n=1 Tax=Candidatus Marsarchaeota G2 archaeon BE_D TaxID=1978158 RepID=A0A2R6BS81_9ARCH|nr:MAG: hypothetical protein B9Q04_20685 [Candidatus Marsarchaeota G2 archaeon BE_D]
MSLVCSSPFELLWELVLQFTDDRRNGRGRPWDRVEFGMRFWVHWEYDLGNGYTVEGVFHM